MALIRNAASETGVFWCKIALATEQVKINFKRFEKGTKKKQISGNGESNIFAVTS
jgi:hypothetical protein